MRQVGGVVFAGFRRDAKIGTEERGSEFGSAARLENALPVFLAPAAAVWSSEVPIPLSFTQQPSRCGARQGQKEIAQRMLLPRGYLIDDRAAPRQLARPACE